MHSCQLSWEPCEAALEGDVVKNVIFLAIIRLHLKSSLKSAQNVQLARYMRDEKGLSFCV